jgi:type III restriction enzyme
MAKHPDYSDLFGEVDLTREVQEVHDGYFSIDKKGGWTDTEENNQTNRDNAERAYNLIMKDKEKLLSMDTPLKFIFSHSALREGWDNPNVFQICALREMGSETQRRQTIGRGLRLCVNQDGERVRGFEVNTLTVVATEGYEQFAENLQHEIEQETGIRFGIIEKHQFAAVSVTDDDGRIQALGVDNSEKLWEELRAQKYIDATGRAQDVLRVAIRDGKLVLPEEFEEQREQVTEILRKACGRLEVKDADERKQIGVRREVLDSPEFKALWDRIKHKTTYRVQFDNEKLISDCISEISNRLSIPKTHLVWRRADIAIGRGGVGVNELQGSDVVMLEEGDIVLPDVVTELQDRTRLTRRTIVRILTESKRLNDFRRNPQEYIDRVADIINSKKRLALVDGIKYQPLGDGYYYAQELFQEEELTGYIRNLIEAERSVYEHIICDSGPEKTFAEELHKNRAIKVYVKLPGWFKVPTPLGSYNPDWAVVVERDGVDHLYFVVETKSTLLTDELRSAEMGKITCGREHFRSLARDENPARFVTARTVKDVVLYETGNE